jgi:hypothetical protein
MSSRALRRVQRELQEKQQLEQLAKESADDAADRESHEDEVSTPKPSLFAMLGNVDDEDQDADMEEAEVAAEASDPTQLPELVGASAPKPPRKSKKKKKKKAKGKARAALPETDKTPSLQIGLDEIDQALLALGLTSKNQMDNTLDLRAPAISEEKQQLYSALSVGTQHLHAANEMRKLFGRTAVQGGNDDEPAPRPRRGQQAALAGPVAGRNALGRNLASLGLRRNVFIQGKEEWPRATSGGLGMEIVNRRDDGSVEYRFLHSIAYQSIQQQFETCVASMDPERMVQLLHYNPYHISTLLQVSEIAKQSHDNSTSGEFLERALFTFGRAVHSTFANSLSQGKARLDFRRPENREFWLAVSRYISTLGIRATWRTACEWGKLLISLSPEDDPYCMRLLIDQLALRGREPQTLVDLVECDHLQRIWKIPPNLAYSVALAHDRLRQPAKARKALRLAIKEYPWIAARICKYLEISPIPKSVWGKEPNGDHQELLCQLYVPHVKDLWNTTEATSLLVEVCYSLEEPLGTGDPYWLADINELDLARRVILSDDRDLLALLNPRVKARYTSTFDPLPPDNSISSYSTSSGSQVSHDAGPNQIRLLAELEQLRQYFLNVNLPQHMDMENDPTEEELLQVLEQAGTSYQEFRRNLERWQQIRPRLQELGVEVVFQGGSSDGDGESNGDREVDTDSDI